ncbi:MAG: metallophosphoesterase [Nitrospirota bacterium]
MRTFLIFFFALYGSLHLYAFLKIKNAFDLSKQSGLFIALFMAVMIVAPIIVRLSEKAGHEFFARVMSYIGYFWMGILFLFISISLIIDIYRLLLYAGSYLMRKDFSIFLPSGHYAFYVPLALSLLIVLYGYFEALNIRTQRITIKTSKIPEEVGQVRIVQISDVHLGLIVREKKLRRILKEVQAAHPDILVSTGDLVDGQINDLSGLSELLKEIKPRYGKYAITGNHEFYAGLEQSLVFTEKSGFKILRGEGLTMAGIINIAGFDDPQGKTYGLYNEVAERDLLSGFSREKFTLLLKHRPLVDKDANGLFDLQLSGHVHKGQIFPFSIITGLYYPVQAGFATLSERSKLYVSRGSGTWGPPVRFLSPPEVTLIDLVHEGM